MEKGEMKIAPSTPNLVHRRHHLVPRNGIGPVRHIVPGTLWSVRLISVDLGIDDRHRGSSSTAKTVKTELMRRSKERRYSITSSALACSVSGTVSPSALAVF